jgi:hypothetical protein
VAAASEARPEERDPGPRPGQAHHRSPRIKSEGRGPEEADSFAGAKCRPQGFPGLGTPLSCFGRASVPHVHGSPADSRHGVRERVLCSLIFVTPTKAK